MGRRGPPPKPTELKLLEGTYRKDRDAKGAPTPEKVATLACPRHLQGIARTEWKRLVPELARLGLLTRVDQASIEGYCMAYQKARQADTAIKKYGLLVKLGPILQQNPAVSISRNEWGAVRRFAAEFGLTPSARTRINVKPGKEEEADSAKAFLFGPKRA